MDYKTIIADICILSAEEDASWVGEKDYYGIDGVHLCKKTEIQEVYNRLKGMKLSELILACYRLIIGELQCIGVECGEIYVEKLPIISQIISAIDDNRDLILDYLKKNPKKYCS